MTYIGIDPDLIKSGVAIWQSKPAHLEVRTMDFFELMDFIAVQKRTDPNVWVFLEAGWKNKKSNFHGGDNKAVSDRIAKNVGENHGAGKLIEQYLIKEKVTYHTITPSSHKWNALDFKKITGICHRTNSEMRDAAKLVYGR